MRWVICSMIAMLSTATAEQSVTGHRSLRQSAPACALDPVPADERLVVLGSSTPVVASNLMFAGSDREATLIKVIVESGPERLALAIFGENERIYEIEDPNGRLARVLLIMSRRTEAGVAGIPRDNVHFIDFSGCSRDYRQTIRRATGQSPHVQSDAPMVLAPVFDHVPEVFVLSSAERIFVPSGERREIIEGERHGTTIVTDSEKSPSYQVQRVEIGPDGQWIKKPIETYAKSEVSLRMTELLFEYPGGVRRIDPATVLSRVPVSQSPHFPAADR